MLIAMYSSPAAEGQRLDNLSITTAGAPPAPPVIRTIEGMGATIHHVYGLTETYGPHTICARQSYWEDLSTEELARAKARQGVPYIIAHSNLIVADDGCHEVPRDGETVGEVMMRGNNVMAGYYKDPEATDEAFRHGWFHSGDMAVWHPDGYIEVMDRAKDVINLWRREHLKPAGRESADGAPCSIGGCRGGDAGHLLGRVSKGVCHSSSG